MKAVNINIAEETLRKVNHIATLRNKSVDELLEQLLVKGVEDTCYRMKRNAAKWQENKALRQLAKDHPELLNAEQEEA